MISLKNVTLSYHKQPVLKNLSLSFKPGSFNFVTGLSGSGKTTLLQFLHLDLEQHQGSYHLFSHDVKLLSRHNKALLRRRMGFIFQNFRLIPHLSARENVLLPLKIAGTYELNSNALVEELLTWVGLSNKFDDYPHNLSGGEQQRIAIARAVINRPDILFADEPTGNLDPALSIRLLYLFEELNRSGTTVIIATHDENLVQHFNYRRILLHEGTVTEM